MSIISDSYTPIKYYSYNEYGKQTAYGNASFINSETYTGSVTEGGNVFYMMARFYDANNGRFLTQDTYKGNAWEPMSHNLYSYVGNNPINYVDPTGHRPMGFDEEEDWIRDGNGSIVYEDDVVPSLDEKFGEAIGEWFGEDIQVVNHISTVNIPNNGNSYYQDQTDATVSYMLSFISGGAALLITLLKNRVRHDLIDIYEIEGTYKKEYYCRSIINEELKDVKGVTVPYQFKYITIYFNDPLMRVEDIEYIESMNDGPPRGDYND